MKSYMYYVLMKCVPPMPNAVTGSESELGKLTAEGWRPVRETPMGGSAVGGDGTPNIGFVFASLILLEREEEAKSESWSILQPRRT